MLLSSRWRIVSVLLLSSLASYLGIVNLLDRIQWKRPTDGIAWTQNERGVVVRLVVDFASSTILEPGDRLVSINQIPIHNLDDYTEVIELLAGSLATDSQASYVVQKKGSQAELVVPVRIRLVSTLGSGDLFVMLVALVHLLIGLFIFLRNWRTPAAYHFFLICLVAFVLYGYRYSGRADFFDLLVYWASAVAFLLLPPLFLHFCLIFPKPLRFVVRQPRVKWVFYAPGALLLGLHVAWFLGSLQPFGLPFTPDAAQFLDRLHLLHFILFFLAGAAALMQGRREISDPVQQMQMKWVVGGSLIGVLPFTLFYALPYLLQLPIHPAVEAVVLSLGLVPLSFAYAITRYRLMDVEVIFKQGATYILASSALLGVYIGVVLLLGRLLHAFTPQSGFLVFGISALLVAFLFAPLKNRIQDQLDRYFYREQYRYRRSLAEFAQTLTAETSLARLAEMVSTRIHRALRLTSVAIFLPSERQAGAFRQFYPWDDSGRSWTLSVPSLEREGQNGLPRLFPVHHVEDPETVRALEEAGFQYLQPLQVRNRVVGFLGLGEPPIRQFLSSEDVELIETLAGYAAIAVDNALLYQSLENKAAELEQLKVYNESVIQGIPVGVVALNPDGCITVWNNAMKEILGVGDEQVLGRPVESVLPPDLIRTLREVLDGTWLASNTRRIFKAHLQNEGGDSRMVNITISPFVSREDVITGSLLIFDDITEKTQLENQLLQAEKLSSIGLFAAGVAHEVNTPLAGISSYTQILLKQTQPEDPRREILEKIEKQTFRASSIVNNLLNFARCSETDYKEVNINSLMLETLSLLDHQLRSSKIEVKLDLDTSLPRTVGNGGRLQQVFMNLFLNAKDAMPKGGQIRVRTYHQRSSIVIQVQDTGMGIPPDQIKRIYDPFFTTKGVGKGTGLGLSVSYGIIQEHSGRISVESKPGQGTTFVLQLPVKRIQ